MEPHPGTSEKEKKGKRKKPIKKVIVPYKQWKEEQKQKAKNIRARKAEMKWENITTKEKIEDFRENVALGAIPKRAYCDPMGLRPPETMKEEIRRLQAENNHFRRQQLASKEKHQEVSTCSSEYQPREGIGAGSENLIEAQQMEIPKDKLRTIKQATMASFQQALVKNLQSDYFALGPNDPKNL